MWSDERWTIACRCGAKHISKSKCTKHLMFGALLEVEMSKRCTPFAARSTSQKCKNWRVQSTCGSWNVEKVHAAVAQSTFRSQNAQNASCLDRFWKLRCRISARRSGAKHILKSMFAPLLDVEASFCLAGARDCAPGQKWAKREGFVAFLKTMAGVGHLKRICKDHLSIGTRPPALHSTFHFWRKSRRIVSFLMLSIPKIEEVSQTCFVFDVLKFKNWGSLADLFRFWCCQAQTLRKSRRIASFSSLQKDRQTDRQIDR